MSRVSRDPKLKKGDVVCVAAGPKLWRPVTPEELRAWWGSPASKGLNDAGETKLPPRSSWRRTSGETYTVVRSRISAPRGYGGKTPKCAELVDSEGVHWYAERRHLAVVGGK